MDNMKGSGQECIEFFGTHIIQMTMTTTTTTTTMYNDDDDDKVAHTNTCICICYVHYCNIVPKIVYTVQSVHSLIQYKILKGTL